MTDPRMLDCANARKSHARHDVLITSYATILNSDEMETKKLHKWTLKQTQMEIRAIKWKLCFLLQVRPVLHPIRQVIHMYAHAHGIKP